VVSSRIVYFLTVCIVFIIKVIFYPGNSVLNPFDLVKKKKYNRKQQKNKQYSGRKQQFHKNLSMKAN